MKREMLLETMKLADKEVAMLENKLGKTAMEELERQAGILKLPEKVRKDVAKMVKNIVHADLHSATFSQRVWANNRELLRRLEAGVERSILRGYNPKEWSRSVRELVRDEMGDAGKVDSLYAANRITITETARPDGSCHGELSERGFEQYVWITEPTACHICAPYDGEVFDVEGSKIGGDLPPMHPFCRCIVAAYLERTELEEPILVGNFDTEVLSAIEKQFGPVHTSEIYLRPERSRHIQDRHPELEGTLLQEFLKSLLL